MITGNQLLNWLKAQTPATLMCPVGFTNAKGEYKELSELPLVHEAHRDAKQIFGRVRIIRIEVPDLGPKPD
jgi:hypothetical protein